MRCTAVGPARVWRPSVCAHRRGQSARTATGGISLRIVASDKWVLRGPTLPADRACYAHKPRPRVSTASTTRLNPLELR